MSRYVDAAFEPELATQHRAYPKRLTLDWLGWLALAMHRHSAPVFFVDRLQPEWLPTPVARAWYSVVDRLGSPLSRSPPDSMWRFSMS